MLYSRKILEDIKRILPKEEIVILTGGRQVGKTSLLLLIKNFLEDQGEVCHYFNLENPDYLTSFNSHPFKIFEVLPQMKRKQVVFIDEIQYLDDPTNFLKLLYDEKRAQIRIIVSGSSAFYIDKKFKDSLAGRKFLFEVYTLNFREFLIFHKKEDLLTQSRAYERKELLLLWDQYLTYGGYPKVVLEPKEEIKRMILEEIGSSYIKKDIADAGIKNTEKYFMLLKILAAQTGDLVNSQELANTLNVTHKTIEEYLYVIRKSYQVAWVKPFFRNLRKELTKMPKVYFYDLGLRNFFLNNYASIEERFDKGAYLENIVYRELLGCVKNSDKIKFWRTQTKKEVDFVVDNKAFEVKFDRQKIREKHYEEFQRAYSDINFQFLTYDQILMEFYRD